MRKPQASQSQSAMEGQAPEPKQPSKARPSRRRSLAPEVQQLLIDATPTAARALIALVEDPETSASVRCQAAEHILNRVYGKAAQPIDASVGGNGDPVIVAFAGVLQEWAR